MAIEILPDVQRMIYRETSHRLIGRDHEDLGDLLLAVARYSSLYTLRYGHQPSVAEIEEFISQELNYMDRDNENL